MCVQTLERCRKDLTYVDVIWKDINSRENFKIGVLTKNGKFTFKYNREGVVAAQKKGFKGLVAFPDFDKEYCHDELFPVFELRLPDRRRKDLPEILKAYGMEKYDAFELLKRTEGKAPTDTLSFVEPIFMEQVVNKEEIIREFYVAGVRHCDTCSGLMNEECTTQMTFHKGELLELVSDPTNEHDPYAIKVMKGREKIGYIPAYYSEQVSKAIALGRKVNCRVKYFRTENSCQECLRIILIIE